MLGVLPAAAALRDRDLAAYHGVEHKAIGAYERGSFDPADAPKEHERCGSNLIVPLLVLSVAGQLVVERLFKRPGPLVRARSPAWRSVSGAVELFAYAERQPDSALGRADPRVGHQIQRLVLHPRADRRAARGRLGRPARGPSRRGGAGSRRSA